MQSCTAKGGGGTKCAFPGASASNPILRVAEFARHLLAASTMAQENPVDLPYESVGKWKALPEPAKSVFERGYIVGDFYYVIHRGTGHFFQLKH